MGIYSGFSFIVSSFSFFSLISGLMGEIYALGELLISIFEVRFDSLAIFLLSSSIKFLLALTLTVGCSIFAFGKNAGIFYGGLVG